MKNNNKIRNTIKNITLIILGGLIFGGVVVYAESLLSSNQVIYDNSSSGSYSDTVQGALDELYARQGMYDNIRIVDNKIYFNTEYINNHPIYFNPNTGEKCNNYTESNSQTEKKDGCMKWYAYSQNQDGTINMILDHNTTSTVYWNSSGNNESGPGGGSGDLLDQLRTDTSEWSSELIAPEKYKPSSEGFSWEIDYSNYGNRARLISAEEIAEITKNDRSKGSSAIDSAENPWTLGSSWFLFDKETAECYSEKNCDIKGITSKYWWLFDNLGNGDEYINCTQHGCKNGQNSDPNGYWTPSPYANNSNNAWRVFYGGGFVNNYVRTSEYRGGIRPVITVSKEKIK